MAPLAWRLPWSRSGPTSDLIILVIPGRDVYRWETLQKSRELRHVPVIALTTLDDDGDRVGCNGHCAGCSTTKPARAVGLQPRVLRRQTGRA